MMLTDLNTIISLVLVSFLVPAHAQAGESAKWDFAEADGVVALGLLFQGQDSISFFCRTGSTDVEFMRTLAVSNGKSELPTGNLTLTLNGKNYSESAERSSSNDGLTSSLAAFSQESGIFSSLISAKSLIMINGADKLEVALDAAKAQNFVQACDKLNNATKGDLSLDPTPTAPVTNSKQDKAP